MGHPLDIQKVYKPNWVLLDQSENPFGFAFNRYPNLEHEKGLYKAYINYLNTDLSTETSIKVENMLFTRGAADAIDLILRTFCLNNGSKVVATDPTFFLLKHWSHVYGISLIESPLNGEYYNQLDVDSIVESEAEVCFVINPNNPASTALAEDNLQMLIKKFRGLIVIDEAYVDFCHNKTVVHQLQNNPNIMILRTMSKAWGSAGIRGGFIIASESNILTIKRIQPPFMCDSYVCEYLTSLLSHRYEEFCLYRSLIIESRNAFIDFLSNYTNLRVLPSQTNFVVIQTTNAREMEAVLKNYDFIVKRAQFREQECIRISIGTPIEMGKLTSIFKSEVSCAVVC